MLLAVSNALITTLSIITPALKNAQLDSMAIVENAKLAIKLVQVVRMVQQINANPALANSY